MPQTKQRAACQAEAVMWRRLRLAVESLRLGGSRTQIAVSSAVPTVSNAVAKVCEFDGLPRSIVLSGERQARYSEYVLVLRAGALLERPLAIPTQALPGFHPNAINRHRLCNRS